jgi:hypothetical protein
MGGFMYKYFMVLALLVLFLTVNAPVGFTMVTGTVTDTNGAPVVGATVTFINESNPDNNFSDLTDAQGRYAIDISITTAVDASTPSKFSLGQNYPNPFNPTTTIPFTLDSSGQVSVSIYNIMGQKVATVIDNYMNAGSHSVMWDGMDNKGNHVSAGIYLYQLRVGLTAVTKKMLLLDGGDSHVAKSSMNSGTKSIAKIAAETTYFITITHNKIIPYKKFGINITDGQTLDFVVFLIDGPVVIQGNISAFTTWKNGNVYIISDWVSVDATLTIEPGVVVKFDKDAFLTVSAGGTINANGTSMNPITFTSIKDDTKGGDINGDGAASTPSKNDWAGVSIGGGNNSSFTNCAFLYSSDALTLSHSAKASVASCIFAHNTNGLVATDSSYGTTLTNNIMWDNEFPMFVNVDIPLDNSNIFHNPDLNTQGNTNQQIIMATGSLTHSITWGPTSEAPIVISDRIGVNGTLTIAQGVVIKFKPSAYIDVAAEGTLISKGIASSPITFTSIKSEPARSDWIGIFVQGNSTVFAYCSILYSRDGLSITNGSRSSVDHVTFAHNKTGLNLTDAAVGTNCSNCSLDDNETPMFTNANINLDMTNSFSKNTYQQISMTHGSVDNNIKWSSSEAAIVITDWVSVISTLTLGKGTVLKFKQGAYFTIEANGTVNGLDEASFTSYKDDTQGGDSNGDGSASSPASGDWDGVWNANTQKWIQPTHISYAAN